MLPLVVVVARLAQFLGAVILFGSPLFFLYGLPARGPAAAASLDWPQRLFAAAGGLLLAGALLSLGAQTATMTGDLAEAYNPNSIWTVLSGTQFGLGIGARIACTVSALLICVLRPTRGLWLALTGLGGAALASFAWTGHGAADDGAAGVLHLVADAIHLLAAGVWLGALAVLALLLVEARRREGPLTLQALHGGLAGFSGVGTTVVAALVATGLVNSWFLIGPTHLRDLFRSAYSLLLLTKLALFAAMLALAAINRFRLTPALGSALGAGSAGEAVRRLQRSVLIESGAGLAVIAVVSALGTLAPLSAME